MSPIFHTGGGVVDFVLPTEEKVARVLAERAAGRLRYCHDAGAWYQWDGALWRRDRTGAAMQTAREIARELGTDPWGKTGATPGRSGFVGGVERFARGDPALAVTAESWDQDPYLLGTPAGPIDLHTGETVPADPGQGVSKATAVAPADAADCPLWLRFLDETFGDDALVGFVQRFLGYALTGDVGEQVLLFGWGAGGNGKSVLLDTVCGLMGDYARPAALETFLATRGARNPADLAALAGARLVAVTETEAGRVWDERRIKLVTGNDLVPARFAHGDAFAFRPRFKLCVVGNHPPALRHVDEATRRRFRVLPFTRVPERPDRALGAKLAAEWPAILRWMIDGCLDWQADGLAPPARVADATAEYLGAQDLLGQFLAEACETGDPQASAPAGALFSAWCDFAKAMGEPAGSQRAFGDALAGQGFSRERTRDGRFHRGLGLRQSVIDAAYGQGHAVTDDGS